MYSYIYMYYRGNYHVYPHPPDAYPYTRVFRTISSHVRTYTLQCSRVPGNFCRSFRFNNQNL